MNKLILFNFNVFIINVLILFVKNVFKFIKKKIVVVLKIIINVLYVKVINKFSSLYEPFGQFTI